MKKELAPILHKVIIAIYNSPTESFFLKDLKHINGFPIDKAKEIVELLIELDLIEIEFDNQIKKCYLTPESYPLIDNNDLEDYLNSFISSHEKDVLLENTKTTFEHKINSNDNQPWKMNYIIAIVFIILNVTVYLYLFPKKEKDNLEISPEMLEEFNKEILIMTDSVIYVTP